MEHVNHPKHYNSHPNGIECIDIIRHYVCDIANAIKYLWRAALKPEMGMEDAEKEIEDLKKALWYIEDYATNCSGDTCTDASRRYMRSLVRMITGHSVKEICEVYHRDIAKAIELLTMVGLVKANGSVRVYYWEQYLSSAAKCIQKHILDIEHQLLDKKLEIKPVRGQIEVSQEDYDFLKELSHELATQTNDGNADPVYWGVMEHRMEPAPEGCGDAIIYMGDGATMTTEEAVEYINENIADYSEDVQDEWKNMDDFDRSDMDTVVNFLHDEMQLYECRIVWEEEKDFISRETGAFITKRACKEYIEKCHYNHSKPHTYAMTAYRNYELGRLLKILRNGMDFTPTTD